MSQISVESAAMKIRVFFKKISTSLHKRLVAETHLAD